MPFVQARISKDLSDSEKTALQKELTAIVKDELHKPHRWDRRWSLRRHSWRLP